MRLLHSLFALLLLAGVGGAVRANTEQNTPLLWRIEAATPQYLFGTVHIPDPRVTTLHPEVEQAFAESEIVLTELKLDMNTMTAAAQASLLPANQSLSKMLTLAQLQQLKVELNAISSVLQPGMFDRLKPWAMATQLALLPIQLKHPGVPALDYQLAQRAEAEGKRNEGLEQLQEQLGIFDGLKPAEQIALLQDSLNGLAKARKEGKDPMELLTQAYLRGDEAQLQQVMKSLEGEQTPLNDRLMKALIDDRNQTMANRLAARFKAKPDTRHFVAVGAAHLVGEKSVIALLQKQGYRITRIK